MVFHPSFKRRKTVPVHRRRQYRRAGVVRDGEVDERRVRGSSPYFADFSNPDPLLYLLLRMVHLGDYKLLHFLF